MRIERPHVNIVQQQSEEITGERELTEEETKRFLYDNHPELYKQMYPDTVIHTQKQNIDNQEIPLGLQKRENQDIQKSDAVYKYDKYGSAELNDYNDFSYNIQITTDMKMNNR